MHLLWNTLHPRSALPGISRTFVAGWGALSLTYAIRSFISSPVNWGHCPMVLVIGAIIDPAWLSMARVQTFESGPAAILDKSGATWAPVPPTEWQRIHERFGNPGQEPGIPISTSSPAWSGHEAVAVDPM